ncbi:hypothetical protein BpHYR1_049728 [Brachionus plicatilis]|uniref:MULE transposase domain-containing protein n=1 Tax=Brachionus plicatilis TaxID=10195 RepID=A0A3M7SAS8_BRAPC|nr:hypothetical protein BpHYR1_049728 [Brachionus plicatilis]
MRNSYADMKWNSITHSLFILNSERTKKVIDNIQNVQVDVQQVVNDLCCIQSFDDSFNDQYLNEICLEDSIHEPEVLDVAKPKSSKQVDPLVMELNKLSLDSELKEQAWEVMRTAKKGYLLFSLGLTYVVDKPKLCDLPTATTIYWKCNFAGCKGRGISAGLNPPLQVTQSHISHKMNPAKLEYLNTLYQIKAQASDSSDQPRLIIRRTQLTLSTECVSMLRNVSLTIPTELTKTYKNKLFYFADSGSNDRNRVILFTTEDNLKLLSKFNDWYCDGTFDISPTLFKQVYSFHVIINDSALPMMYALLPNKKQLTYKKMFKMVKSLVQKSPSSINVDFELAAINAIKAVFNCKIYGCYFHLCQSMWRRVQKRGKVKYWYDESFRTSFRRLQSLAYLPLEDVSVGFEYVRSCSPLSFVPILDYFKTS